MYGLTHREFVRELVIAKQRRDDALDRSLHHAWHVAALQRQKELPPLSKLLTRRSSETRQSPAEMAAIWQVAAARFGGAFTPMNPADYAKVIRG